MIETSSVVVRPAKTYEVKIGDTIWSQGDGDWLLVWDIQDNGYGDITFRRDAWQSSVWSVTAGDTVLVREDDWTLIPNNLKEGISVLRAPEFPEEVEGMPGTGPLGF